MKAVATGEFVHTFFMSKSEVLWLLKQPDISFLSAVNTDKLKVSLKHWIDKKELTEKQVGRNL